MKIKEVSQTFNIPITSLRYYEDKGLFEGVKRINGVREYEDKDIQRLSLILSLKKTGLRINDILVYIESIENGNSDQCIHLLQKQRIKLLGSIHDDESSMDCIDYLIFKITKNKEETK